MPKSAPSSELTKAVGLRLKAARLAVGLDQGDLAEPIGASQHKWSQWENGRNLPDVSTMILFCNRYGITMDWLYREVAAGMVQGTRDAVIEAYAELTSGDNPKRPKRPRLTA